MNCIIPAQNTKVLSKSINSLAKIGDEIYLEATRDQLKFVSLNISKTVYAQFCLLKSFFSSYDIKEDELTEENKETITCKLFTKSLLPLFKGNLEKKLDFLKIEYDTTSDFIVFKMKYKYDKISLMHKLRLMDPDILSINITPNSEMNNLCASSTLLNQVLSMFNTSDSEITLEILNSRVIARNYYVGSSSNPKLMRCEVKLSAGEFIIFDVKNEATINFALKPLRTVISFAETFNVQVGLNFDSGGKPLTLVMKNPTFEISFIVSTLNPNGNMQSTLASTSIPTCTQRSKRNLNITLEDQQAMESENWEDMDFEKYKKNMNNKSSALIINRQNSNQSSEKSGNGSKKSDDQLNCPLVFQDENCDISEKRGKNKKNTFMLLMNKAGSNDNSDKISNSQSPLFKNEMDVDVNINLDIIPNSPESPRRKKVKLVFSRCFEPTIYLPDLGTELYGSSDSEC